MQAAWLFVLASTIAVIGILISFKKLIQSIGYKIEHDEMNKDSLQKEQSRYFVRVAFTEAVPILLIIFGFMQIENTSQQLSNIVIALLIIIGLLIFALFQIILSRSELLQSIATDSENKNIVNTVTMIGIVTIVSIPIISIIGLFM